MCVCVCVTQCGGLGERKVGKVLEKCKVGCDEIQESGTGVVIKCRLSQGEVGNHNLERDII